MRSSIETASAGYAVTYLAGILVGFPWGQLASALTAIWFLWLLAEKAYRKIWHKPDAGPES